MKQEWKGEARGSSAMELTARATPKNIVNPIIAFCDDEDATIKCPVFNHHQNQGQGLQVLANYLVYYWHSIPRTKQHARSETRATAQTVERVGLTGVVIVDWCVAEAVVGFVEEVVEADVVEVVVVVKVVVVVLGMIVVVVAIARVNNSGSQY